VLSHAELARFFGSVGLLDAFRRKGRLCFDKDQLQQFKDRHPAIPLIRAVRRAYSLREDKTLAEELVGADGRVHPDHRQLGTHTGRQTCCNPNLLGLDRVLRPVVVPDPGRGIGDVDWSQVEVGIAAAIYRDPILIKMFNTDDVYSAMAKHSYRDQLSEADRSLGADEFKRLHRPFRERMKTCTLGIIYGLTPRGLALYLNTSRVEAKALLARFMSMFPALRQALTDAAHFGAARGYVSTSSGLQRHRADRRTPASAWERNWMTNHPVQGSAAAIFKDAGNRLDRLYPQYDAWLIVPFHDAFVFEAPLGVLDEVARLTAQVMCQTLQEHFPELRPRVEVNACHPECWNKEGHAGALERWFEDPTYSV